ncbi:MAG: 30S ribosomal protein S17 [Candidatus Omnitrophica bacterium]|nr:30S ribosomal protein S17 [Candidatus Omnitrophota bacterium]
MTKKRVEKTGIVVSDKMDKTRVVLVEFMTQHPIYKKTIRKRRKFMAHDEENITKVGDIVRIVQTRPLSRRKRWKVIEIIGKKGVISDSTQDNASGS